jgi:hypothetical protein
VLGHAAENRLPVLDGMRRDGEDAVSAVRHGNRGFLARRTAILRKSVGFNEMPRRGVTTRFPTWAAVLNYRGSARGLRFTVSLRIGAVFPGGPKTAEFLGDRISVRVVSGSGTATLECGRKPAGIHRNRSAAQKFFHRWPRPGRGHVKQTRMCHVRAFKMGHD